MLWATFLTLKVRVYLQPLLRRPNAPESCRVRRKTQNISHFAVQGHHFWYRSKAHRPIRLPISDQY